MNKANLPILMVDAAAGKENQNKRGNKNQCQIFQGERKKTQPINDVCFNVLLFLVVDQSTNHLPLHDT
jgi:hypothetical protein